VRVTTLTLAALLLAAPVSAAPITLGSWHDAPAASNSGDSPWSHVSLDCALCNAGYVMGIGPGWQFLDAPWVFVTEPGTEWHEVYTLTAYQHRVISQTPSGAFDYLNLDTGDHYTSDGADWRQFVMLREILDADTTRYTVLLEDVRRMDGGDSDYNDSILRAVERTQPGGEIDTRSVPEPSMLALLGAGLLAAARRLRRRG
jgi:hypothetical protein